MPVLRRALHKLGEDVTKTLELIPRQWKVIQHVREKFSCRTCEATTQPSAPSHPIARGPHILWRGHARSRDQFVIPGQFGRKRT
jgi:transposase